jgi:hypothetical protein
MLQERRLTTSEASSSRHNRAPVFFKRQLSRRGWVWLRGASPAEDWIDCRYIVTLIHCSSFVRSQWGTRNKQVAEDKVVVAGDVVYNGMAILTDGETLKRSVLISVRM